ncbi:Glycosyl hydrolase family 81 [Fragilaria crotonensis]|nr:Glycosyl hydrolase family 81 [Fragilaria crotonensis]
MDSDKRRTNDAARPKYRLFNYGSTNETPQTLQSATAGHDDTSVAYALPEDGFSSSFHQDATERERLTNNNRILETTPKEGSDWLAKATTHHRVTFALVAALLLWIVIMIITPRPIVSSLKSAVLVVFPMADRGLYGDSASNFIQADLFHPNLLFQSVSSDSNLDPFLKVPFPTGAFWMNLVMAPAADGFSFPVVAYPYAFTWSDNLLQASFPYIRRRIDDYSIRDIVQPDITFGVMDRTLTRQVVGFDPLSVTLRFSTATESSTSSDGYWETYLIPGSPYITTKHDNTKPVLKALSTFIKVSCLYDANSSDGQDGCSQSDINDEGFQILNGMHFLIHTQEGMKWLLVASENVEISFDTRIRTTIVATTPFSGVLRLAYIPLASDDNPEDLSQLSASTGLRRLVDHASAYPTGGSVSWDFESTEEPFLSRVGNTLKPILGMAPTDANSTAFSGKIGNIHFKYETRMMNGNSNSELLMLGLPHHADVLSPDSMLTATEFDLQYWCIKGQMVPVIGSTWSYQEELTNTQFDRVHDIHLDPSVANIILQNIKFDMNLFPTMSSLNIYGYGKQVARLAQLAHAAKVLTKQGNLSQAVLHEIAGRLHASLSALLGGDVEDELLYDAQFGGIVSKNGLHDPNEDFGNGRYNDHHFHYGYILYASAVMGSLNSSFVHQYGSAVDNLLYDIAYSGNADSLTADGVFFPFARYKSWYDGHSFASGLFQQGNGKSQESTSEAINGYYGGYLWCMVKNMVTETDVSAESRDFLRLLLATEIRGAKSYWQMVPPQPPNSGIVDATPERYEASFRKNYMVGNLGMLDAVCSTYFATELFYVHLINIIPVTAITVEIFGQAYAREQYEAVIAKAEIPVAWKGYAACDLALSDPSAAWTQALELISGEIDSALSKVKFYISSARLRVSKLLPRTVMAAPAQKVTTPQPTARPRPSAKSIQDAPA